MAAFWRQILGSIALLMLVCNVAIGTNASAQTFTTIINIPPNPDPRTIGSDTQLNLFDGGVIAEQFVSGNPDGTDRNIEINISGGEVGVGSKAFNSNINFYDGTIGYNFEVYDSTLNISGGQLGQIPGGILVQGSVIARFSTINISDGIVGSFMRAYDSMAPSRSMCQSV